VAGFLKKIMDLWIPKKAGYCLAKLASQEGFCCMRLVDCNVINNLLLISSCMNVVNGLKSNQLPAH
jgi:hypothetical protein